jgi:hypothetical protein
MIAVKQIPLFMRACLKVKKREKENFQLAN